MPPRSQARSPETDPGALLGDELREVRVAAGFRNQDVLAERFGVDRSVVGKAETGERPPSSDILKVWLDACGITGPLRRVYERLATVARARSEDSPVRAWFAGYLRAEVEAHVLRFWAPVILPGLVQTQDYARALFIAMGMNEEQVQGQVTTRMARQPILTRPQPPSVIVVLWEPVLYHLIGSPEIMRDQITRLVELSRSIVIQVAPTRLGGNAGLGGSIALAARPGAPEVLLAGSIVEDIVTQDADQVRRAQVTFDQVRGDSLPRADSRTLMMEALEQWNS